MNLVSKLIKTDGNSVWATGNNNIHTGEDSDVLGGEVELFSKQGDDVGDVGARRRRV